MAKKMLTLVRLSKAVSHKYYKRLPDGKGGWRYFYNVSEFSQYVNSGRHVHKPTGKGYDIASRQEVFDKHGKPVHGVVKTESDGLVHHHLFKVPGEHRQTISTPKMAGKFKSKYVNWANIDHTGADYEDFEIKSRAPFDDVKNGTKAIGYEYKDGKTTYKAIPGKVGKVFDLDALKSDYKEMISKHFKSDKVKKKWNFEVDKGIEDYKNVEIKDFAEKFKYEHASGGMQFSDLIIQGILLGFPLEATFSWMMANKGYTANYHNTDNPYA